MTSLITKLQEIFPNVPITPAMSARIKHAVMSHMGNKGGHSKSPDKIKAVRGNLAKANEAKLEKKGGKNGM